MFLKTQVKSIRLISVLQIATWTQTMLHVLQTSHTARHIDIWSPHCICLKSNLNLSGSSTTTHFFRLSKTHSAIHIPHAFNTHLLSPGKQAAHHNRGTCDYCLQHVKHGDRLLLLIISLSDAFVATSIL